MGMPDDRMPCRWAQGDKMSSMQHWAKCVVTDPRSTKGEIAVAWVLMFSFNSDNGRCWLKKSKIAEKVGLSETYVAASLAGLDKNGHIYRTEEKVGSQMMRVIRPTYSRSSVRQEPRQRRGGVSKRASEGILGGTEPQYPITLAPTEVQYPYCTEPQSVGGTEPQYPCIRNRSEINPKATVAGVVTRPPPPEPDWDDEDDSFP